MTQGGQALLHLTKEPSHCYYEWDFSYICRQIRIYDDEKEFAMVDGGVTHLWIMVVRGVQQG